MDLAPLLTALAVIFIGSLIAGRLASFCQIPKVTGYLLVGMAAGPSLAHLLDIPPLITRPALDTLRPLMEIALGLILVAIGGQFRLDNLRRWRGRIIRFSLAEAGLTFLLVAASTFAVNLLLLGRSVGSLSLLQTSVAFALLLGTIAMATAPAATLMVTREYEAEGRVTTIVLTLVGLNNILSILAFAAVSHYLVRPGEGFGEMLYHMGGPVLLGVTIGLVASIWGQPLERGSELKVLLIGTTLALLATAKLLGLDPLLASLVLGITWGNSSPRWHTIYETLREFDYPLYVLFFVVAGANLHLETLSHIGILGFAYVLARGAGKILGGRLGGRLGAFGQRERDHVGMALLAQAGVAIGLAAQLASSWPEGGKLLETVVLGSVVIFELAGPLAVRRALVNAGEVPILSLLQKRASQGALEGVSTVFGHFRASVGIPAALRVPDPGEIPVRHVMRRNVETVRIDTPYAELLKFISHSRYDRFPVLDREGCFRGMINYTEIRNLLFEPALSQLVRAGDLVTPHSHAIPQDTPLREALDTLRIHRDVSYFPVVDPDSPTRLLGILSQNDILAAFHKGGC